MGNNKAGSEGIQPQQAEQSRRSALEGIQQLLVLTDEVPSAQLRLLMQASCLDVIAAIEELSSPPAHRALES